MAEILDAALVRSGTWGQLWLDGELVAECYGCQIKLNKTKEDVARCRTLVAGKKMTAIAGTGTVRIYNATSRLIRAEGQALKNGQDLRHTLISNLEDPDNPNNQRISVTGVSFDDLTLADWEAARLGQIEAPFTFEDFDIPRQLTGGHMEKELISRGNGGSLHAGPAAGQGRRRGEQAAAHRPV